MELLVSDVQHDSKDTFSSNQEWNSGPFFNPI